MRDFTMLNHRVHGIPISRAPARQRTGPAPKKGEPPRRAVPMIRHVFFPVSYGAGVRVSRLFRSRPVSKCIGIWSPSAQISAWSP